MCCHNPNWTSEANAARGVAAAVLTTAIITLFTFAIGTYAAGIASLLAIVSSSILLCCGPAVARPGAGGAFRGSAIVALLACIGHFVGAILLIVWVSEINDTTSSACLDGYCEGSAWQTSRCSDNTMTYCQSESDCRSATCSSCAQTYCGLAGTIVSTWVSILCYPGIVFAFICFALELALALTSWRAAPTMDRSRQTNEVTSSSLAAMSGMRVVQPQQPQPVMGIPTVVPTAPPQPQGGLVLLSAIAPANAVAGQPVQVAGPDGTLMQVALPPGIMPGQSFQFQVQAPPTAIAYPIS